MTRTTKWLAGTNALLGLWLIVAPFVLATSTAGLWNDVVFGLVIASVGTYNYYLTTQGREVSTAAAGLNVVAGLWMIAAPFVLGGITGAAMLSDVTVGVLVTLFAGYNSYVSSGTGADSGRSESTA
jgi:hypothetical protein